MTEIDRDGFKAWLERHNLITDYTVQRAARALKAGATTPAGVDEVFSHFSSIYCADLRRAVRRYNEFEADTRRARESPAVAEAVG